MIGGGVNFQPGSLQQEQERRRSQTGTAQGVQEAIKVLSLRLPKVVGAQAVAPQALLQSPGSGGNSRVDSIVQSVMAKFFPGQGSPAPSAPMQEQPAPQPTQGAPSFSGSAAPQQPQAPAQDFWGQFPKAPNVIVDAPTWTGDFTGPTGDFSFGPDGRPVGNFGPGLIAPLPDLRRQLDWVPPPGGIDPTPLI